MSESERMELNDNASESSLPPALLRYKIPDLPESFYYIANFLTEEEEKQLLNEVGFGSFTFSLLQLARMKGVKFIKLMKGDVCFGAQEIISVKIT